MKQPEWLTENPDGTRTVQLLGEALAIEGATVQALTMREPTVGDELNAQRAGNNEGEQEVALFANLCQVSPDDLRKLTKRNYKRLQVAFVGFME